MKSTDANMEQFEEIFYDDNTLITKPGDDWSKILKSELAKLNASGKTVIITDSYLYNSHGDESYIVAVIDILKSLRAKKIIYTPRRSGFDLTMEKRVIAELNTQGCAYERKKLKNTCKIHDRY